MRKSLAVLATIGLVATMAVTFAGPAAAKGGPKPGTPKPPPKETKCSSSSAKGITYSFLQFLTPGTPNALGYVQNGQPLGTVYNAAFGAAKTAGLLKYNTIPISVVAKCTGKTTAMFTYDLQMKDATTGTTSAPLGIHNAGGAVLVKGHWQITPQTVCDLINLIGMALPGVPYGAQCYQAAGLPVPSS
jgi:hypothetical protein